MQLDFLQIFSEFLSLEFCVARMCVAREVQSHVVAKSCVLADARKLDKQRILPKKVLRLLT